MEELELTPPSEVAADTEAEAHETSEERNQRLIELLAAAVMAFATILTAWSAYQSARWGGVSNVHELRVVSAIVKQSKFANLAEQRRGLDVSLFGQWMSATNMNETKLADFIFARFPEPLKTATIAWLATDPLDDPAAPSSPFAMTEYVLAESAEELRWENVATEESAAAERAGEISDRYLLFTVIFAMTLFFAGISGKFAWVWINIAVLSLGGVVLAISAVIMLALPVA
jgi:hypothetical protein